MTNTLTAEERAHIRDIQADCERLAKGLKRAFEKGIMISFNIDAMQGKVDKFEVVKNVKVDLSKELDS